MMLENVESLLFYSGYQVWDTKYNSTKVNGMIHRRMPCKTDPNWFSGSVGQ